MLALVDLGISNVQSAVRALQRIGVQPVVTASPDDVAKAAAVVLPGVGAFGDGMASLREKGLVDALRRAALDEHRPVVGICLGMQLLADSSEEHGTHDGLGLIRGRVVRLVDGGSGARVPNIGWSDVHATGSGWFPTELDGRAFYFVHSYHMVCDDAAHVVATIRHGEHEVAVGVERANVTGFQFHPEKSQDAGLDLLDGLVERSGIRAALAA